MIPNIFSSAVICENRELYRRAAQRKLESYCTQISALSPIHFIETICSGVEKEDVFAIGLCGAGRDLCNLLQGIHHLCNRGCRVAVWIPEKSHNLFMLVKSLGVNYILSEETLLDELSQLALADTYVSPRFASTGTPESTLQRRITLCELKILFDCIDHKKASDIAILRHLSIKTVYTHRRNLKIHMNIKSEGQWIALLLQLKEIHLRYS